MASCDPPDAQPRPTAEAIRRDGVHGVATAARRVAADRRSTRTPRSLIDRDRGDACTSCPARWPNRVVGHQCVAPAVSLPSRTSARSRSRPISVERRVAVSGSARTTSRDPVGRSASRALNCARSRRDTRCRTTLPPTDLPTTSPTRAGAADSEPPSIEPPSINR